MVQVEYANGPLFSLPVHAAATNPREISILDGTGGRIGIEPQEIHGAIVRPNLDPELRGATPGIWRTSSSRNWPDAAISVVFPATLVCQMANL